MTDPTLIAEVFVHPDFCSIVSFFVCGYTGIMLAFGWTSGWWRLAKHYRRTTQKGEAWFHAFFVYVGLMRYGSALAFSATAEGLFLEAYLPIRVGHPPLFFPWADVSIERVDYMIRSSYQFRFAKVAGVDVEMSVRLGDKILAEAALRGAVNVPVVE